MAKENYNFIISHQPIFAIILGIIILFLVLAFNRKGNGLKDAVDVREPGN
jgi:peptide/nickel transport system permease protein